MRRILTCAALSCLALASPARADQAALEEIARLTSAEGMAALQSDPGWTPQVATLLMNFRDQFAGADQSAARAMCAEIGSRLTVIEATRAEVASSYDAAYAALAKNRKPGDPIDPESDAARIGAELDAINKSKTPLTTRFTEMACGRFEGLEKTGMRTMSAQRAACSAHVEKLSDLDARRAVKAREWEEAGGLLDRRNPPEAAVVAEKELLALDQDASTMRRTREGKDCAPYAPGGALSSATEQVRACVDAVLTENYYRDRRIGAEAAYEEARNRANGGMFFGSTSLMMVQMAGNAERDRRANGARKGRDSVSTSASEAKANIAHLFCPMLDDRILQRAEN